MINIQVTLKTSKTDQNIQKISKIVRLDRRLSVRMIADMVRINRESATNLAEEAAESLEERLNAASGQCPNSQSPFALEVSSQ